MSGFLRMHWRMKRRAERESLGTVLEWPPQVPQVPLVAGEL